MNYEFGKKITRIIFFLILFFGIFGLVESLQAATYYVSANGNDSYDGTTPAYQGGSVGPKKTIAAGLALLKNSDDLKIRQGVYYESGLNLKPGVSGTYQDRITISNYNGESVYLSGGFLISDSGKTSAWSQYSGQVYKDLSGSPYYYNLYWAPKSGNIDELQGIRLGYSRGGNVSSLNEEGEWARQYANGYDHYFYVGEGKSISDYIMIGTFVNNSENKHVFDFTDEHDYVTIDGIWFVASVGVIKTTALSDYITLNNSRFYGIMGNTHGILLKGDNGLIENCQGRIMSSYFISGDVGYSMDTENLTIRNCKFSYNGGNVIHTTGKGMRIQNNEFTHYATSWWYSNEPAFKHAEGVIGHTPASTYFSDLVVENNYFHNPDAAVGNPFGVDEQKWDAEVTETSEFMGNDAGMSFYSACGLPNQGADFIYRNNLHEENHMGFYLTSEKDGCSYKNIRIYGNIFANVGGARTCEGCTILGLKAASIGQLGFYEGKSTFENLQIYNNLFYDYRWGLDLGSRHGDALFPGESFVKNNIFYIQGGWANANDAAGLFFDDGSEISQIKSDHNLFFRPDRSEVAGYRSGSIYGLTLSQWQSSFSKDLNSFLANPLIKNPLNRDYRLSSNSPAIDRGINVGLTKDYYGTAIPLDGNGDGIAIPDIGVYEYQSSAPQDTTPPASPTGLKVN